MKDKKLRYNIVIKGWALVLAQVILFFSALIALMSKGFALNETTIFAYFIVIQSVFVFWISKWMVDQG